MSGECGTRKGYGQHRYRGEEPCDACRSANSAYQREYLARNPDARANQRAYTAAYDRALRRLAEMHPALFAALLAEERTS